MNISPSLYPASRALIFSQPRFQGRASVGVTVADSATMTNASQVEIKNIKDLSNDELHQLAILLAGKEDFLGDTGPKTTAGPGASANSSSVASPMNTQSIESELKHYRKQPFVEYVALKGAPGSSSAPGEILAFAFLVQDPQSPKAVNIENLYLKDERENSPLLRQLTQALVDRAKARTGKSGENQFNYIYRSVFQNRTEEIQDYEAMGFKPYFDEASPHSVLMGKEINAPKPKQAPEEIEATIDTPTHNQAFSGIRQRITAIWERFCQWISGIWPHGQTQA